MVQSDIGHHLNIKKKVLLSVSSSGISHRGPRYHGFHEKKKNRSLVVYC